MCRYQSTWTMIDVPSPLWHSHKHLQIYCSNLRIATAGSPSLQSRLTKLYRTPYRRHTFFFTVHVIDLDHSPEQYDMLPPSLRKKSGEAGIVTVASLKIKEQGWCFHRTSYHVSSSCVNLTSYLTFAWDYDLISGSLAQSKARLHGSQDLLR